MRKLSDDTIAQGSRKTAIILLSLAQELAAQVLGKLPRDQVERVTLAIANASDITRDEQEAVLNEFKSAFLARPLIHPGGPETARELLERTLEQNEVEIVQDQIEQQTRPGPFAFLSGRHADEVRLLLETEHPQTVAVVAAQLPSDLSAELLAGFGIESQADILARIARLGPTDPELLDEIASSLRERIGRAPVRAGGVARAANLLRESPAENARAVLQSLGAQETNLAEHLQERLFTFNDLEILDEMALTQVLQETMDCAWAVALKGTSESLKQHVFKSMNPQMVQALKDEIRSASPARLSEISFEQRKICNVVLSLEASRRVEVPRNASRPGKVRAA